MAGPGDPPPLASHFHVSFCEAKGEDVSVVCKALAGGAAALYAVADGHNGAQAARHVAAALPGELARQLGDHPAATADDGVLRGLARTFVAVNDSTCSTFVQGGCTLTAAVVAGDTLTVANVGDSRALLDTGAEVIELTAEHRIGASPAELSRLEAAGGRLARLNEYGAGPSCGVHDGVGPVRLWPGGIMVGRAIGDRDVGELLLPLPHMRQLKLPPTGARLIIASDGLWDAMPAGRVARVLRGQATAKAAASQAVSSVAASMGGLLRDDVTVVVVDFLPPGCADFRQVVAQFAGRLRNVLSSPQLSSLVMDAPAPPTVEEEEEEAGLPAPRPAPKRGMFACFSKPAVRDSGAIKQEASARGGSARGGAANASARGGGSARGATNWSTRSGVYNPTASIAGSEKSVRSGVARDPSIRGWRRATSVELLYEGDTAEWSASDFGRLPSLALSDAACSRCSSGSVQRSPRSLLESLSLGLSAGSMSSEDDSSELAQAAKLAQRHARSSKSGMSPLGEKKTHGSIAAAALLGSA